MELLQKTVERAVQQAVAHKIHKAKKQDHLGNHRAIRKVTGNLVTTSWITKYLEHLSAVEPQNTIRENKVKRLIENHKHQESFRT